MRYLGGSSCEGYVKLPELLELLSLAVVEHWVLVVSRSLELSEKVKNCCWFAGSDYSGTEGHKDLLLPKLMSCMLIQIRCALPSLYDTMQLNLLSVEKCI